MSSSLGQFLLGPNNPQQVTSSSTTSQQLPTWLQNYSSSLLGAASGLVPSTVSNVGNAQSPVSAANPYLNSASSLVSGATNPATQGLAQANPYLGSASNTVGSALSGPNGVSLASPYVGGASSLVNNSVYSPNNGLSLAAPGINQASAITGSAINPANSGLTAASPYINQADQGVNNTALVNSYMSPYLSDVTGYNTALANQNLQQFVIPAVESQAIANGQFGGSPMGTALGQQIDLTQQNLQAQNLAAANHGYQEATGLAESDLARQGTLGQLAGTLGTQQQGAELQGASTLGSLSGELGQLGTGQQQLGLTGASTLGSLGTQLGSLGNTAQSNALTGANLYGSLGSTAGQLANQGAGIGLSGASTLGSLGNAAGALTGTGNSEQLSQLGLLGSLTGTPGGSTTTYSASNPNPYSEMQTAGSGSSSLANLLTTLTGSNSGGVLGNINSLNSLINGAGGIGAPSLAGSAGYNTLMGGLASPSSLGNGISMSDSMGSPGGDGSSLSQYGIDPALLTAQENANPFAYLGTPYYREGGRVRFGTGTEDHGFTSIVSKARGGPFMAADGGAVELPTFSQDMSLASNPNAIFDPNQSGGYNYAPVPAQTTVLPSLTAFGGAGMTGMTPLGSSLGALFGTGAAGYGTGQPTSQPTSTLGELSQAIKAGKLGNSIYSGFVGSGITAPPSIAGDTGIAGIEGANKAQTAADIAGTALPAADTAGAASSLAAGADTGLDTLTAADTASAVNAAGDTALAGADAATSGSSLAASGLGAAAADIAAPLAIYGAATGWKQGDYGGNTLSDAGAGAAIGTAILPGIGTAAGAVIGAVVGAVSTWLKGPHTMENITNATQPGDSVVKDQSGNSVLLNTQSGEGGIGFGAGSSRGQGSAQWFMDPAQTGSLDFNAATGQQNYSASGFPTAQKGNLYWLGGAGGQELTDFANGKGPLAPTLVNGKPDFSSALAAYQKNPNAGTGIVGVFNNSGGSAMFGESFPQWLQSVWDAKNGVTGNLSTT